MKTVAPADTAAAWGDEFPPAASTPFVLGMAELACHRILAPELSPDELTVGAGVELSHDRPSPVGITLTARARLVDRQGRRATFEVEVSDGQHVVATIRHRRVVVPRAAIEAALHSADG
ncbi:hypothetical protein K8Z49_17360 [Actinomadura madurae]|uniref:thioesterase family protein n=1 Tax=Actinomadura madurae TaxID=1993 RepID=UPI00399AD56A